MKTYNVYQICDEELTDDRGYKTRLQYEVGGFSDKQEAWKEASRLRKLYQGHYNFTVEEEPGQNIEAIY